LYTVQCTGMTYSMKLHELSIYVVLFFIFYEFILIVYSKKVPVINTGTGSRYCCGCGSGAVIRIRPFAYISNPIPLHYKKSSFIFLNK
jgi:hypothetical protein